MIAARAVVDRCPIETTDAITRLYSNRCVLWGGKKDNQRMEYATNPKTGQVYLVSIRNSSQNMVIPFVSSSGIGSTFPCDSKGVFSVRLRGEWS